MYGFTIGAIYARFTLLADLFRDIDDSGISLTGRVPPVPFDRIETVTFAIYSLFGMPVWCVVAVLR